MDRRKKLKTAGQIALVIVGVALIYILIMLVDNKLGILDGDSDDDSQEEELPIQFGDQTYELTHDVSTYLIMGTDKSGNEEAASRDEYDGSMADFLLLVMVDDTDQTYGMIQINRDSMTKVPFLQKDGTAYASSEIQICVSHAYGGSKRESCENTVDAVSMFLGNIPIDGYYALKMEAIPELNHVVGGVTVTIEDDFTSLDPEMEVGKTMRLTDEQAYLFVQSRYLMENDDNRARMRRHRMFMDAFVEEAKKQAADDQKFVANVYESLSDYATTDMGSKTMSNLAQKMNTYTSKGMFSPEGEAKEGLALGDGIVHAEFYVDADSVKDIMMDLYPLRQVEDTDGEE